MPALSRTSLFMLCGPAFAGKSTLARRIAAGRPIRIVSLDGINAERGAGLGGDGLPPHVWRETHEIARIRVDALLGSGQPVIVDDTLCYRWLRDSYREIARRHGTEDLVILLDTSDVEIGRRRLRNDRIGRRGDGAARPRIRDEVFESHMSGFEYPDRDERVVIYRPSDDPDSWIRRVFG
jgi:predicted kinase